MSHSSVSLQSSPIIAISGKQYAGKDVLTRLLLAHLPAFYQLPIAQAIKAEYSRQNHLTVEAVERDKAHHRPALIALGNWGRQQDPDYWLKQVLAAPGQKIVSDMRLKREYDLLREHGAFLIRLNTDRAIRAQRGTLVSEDDPTERELDDVTDWDVCLSNNGSLEDLEANVLALLASR